MCSC
ncbi:hypothetical protein V1477_001224 [Vespula maculifrons]|jgi:chromosome segregation ATPase